MGGGVGGARAGAALDRPDISAWSERVTILLDAHDPQQRGGTGQIIDWEQAAGVAGSRRVLLAGGLTPGNVAEAVRHVRPFGIDVSSGVEARPGVKDHGKLRDLFHAINSHTTRS
jgi:phosphoribosylanthranilate isomerase